MAKTFARQLVEILEKQGARRIFGFVGDSLNPIVDTVRESSIEWVHVRNEEVAASAAGVKSLVTGELAVCAVSRGPGNTHLIQGLYDPRRNDAKVLALASHIPSYRIGSNFFQETHLEFIFDECSGYCEMVNSIEQGGVVLHRAIQSTMTGHGVSVLVLPDDIIMHETENDEFVTSTTSSGRPVIFPDAGQAAALADAIDEAKTVMLFCGTGVKGVHEQVLKLAEKIKSSVGHVPGGKMCIQYDNPYDIGMSGLLDYGACHDVSNDADLLTLPGTDFPYNDFLPTKNVAQADIDGRAIDRRTTVKYPVVGDMAATIEITPPYLDEKASRSFLDRQLRNHERLLSHVIEVCTHDVENMRSIHPEYVTSPIDRRADDDAVFTVDIGMGNVRVARYTTPNGKREQIGSLRHGVMANTLSQAIGVQAADRDRQVVTFNGDGGLPMLLGKLIIVKQERLPIKMFVFNNSLLGMVKLEMLVQGLPEHQIDHGAVDYTGVVESLGTKVIRIEDPADVPRLIQEVLAYDGPVLVDMITDPNTLSIPANITWDMLMGFSKAAIHTVFDSGVGQTINMARPNLRNIPRP